MSAADVASPFASLVRSLVERETDHEQIAIACGVPRTLPHKERTAAILETLRVLAASRAAWHSEALTLRACFRELCAYAGATQPADDAPPSAYLDNLVAVSEARRDHLAGTLALLGLTAPRTVDETLRDLRFAVDGTESARAEWSRLAWERSDSVKQITASRDAWVRHASGLADSLGRITASRDAWRRDASNCADALAAVAEALGIEPTYDPARGTETGARVLAALASLAKRSTAAETALTDVAAALSAAPEGDPYDADAIARGCLATIARDHETAERVVRAHESMRARLDAAERNAGRAIVDAGNLREQLRDALARAEQTALTTDAPRVETTNAAADAATRRREAAREGER